MSVGVLSADLLKTSHYRGLVGDAVHLTTASPCKERLREERRQKEDEPSSWPRQRRGPHDHSAALQRTSA
jgi:hypothetical protein